MEAPPDLTDPERYYWDWLDELYASSHADDRLKLIAEVADVYLWRGDFHSVALRRDFDSTRLHDSEYKQRDAVTLRVAKPFYAELKMHYATVWPGIASRALGSPRDVRYRTYDGVPPTVRSPLGCPVEWQELMYLRQVLVEQRTTEEDAFRRAQNPELQAGSQRLTKAEQDRILKLCWEAAFRGSRSVTTRRKGWGTAGARTALGSLLLLPFGFFYFGRPASQTWYVPQAFIEEAQKAGVGFGDDQQGSTPIVAPPFDRSRWP